ncbi:MAG: TVP38/TMEM64 family protein [Pyrinomonadaceae bacterium]
MSTEPRKTWILFLAVSASTFALLAAGRLFGFDGEWLGAVLQRAGAWAPVLFVLCYAVGVSLLLPATPLNLLAGAVFGPVAGTLLTSAGALVGAVVNFALARSVGRRGGADRLTQKWPTVGGELRRGGAWYVFAMRLLPVIPYGVVSYAAGVSPIRFRDYFWSSLPGTVLGILPFVLIGSSGVRVLQRGSVLPLVASLGAAGTLVLAARLYRRWRASSAERLEESC